MKTNHEWTRIDRKTEGDDDAWTAGGALRFEDFEGFGGTLNGKASARLRLVEAFSLRSSLSTGFRAPTPGQSNAFNVSTQFDLALMDLVNNGTIPSTSAVARLRGGNPLQPETSLNFALGGILERGPFTLTADLFRIDVDDRLALTPLFNLTPEEHPIALYVGERYSEYSPFGFNGAYYYARLSYSCGSAFK